MTRSLRSSTDEFRYSLAREFSRHPGPRYKTQGKFSGQAFREKLLQLLEQHQRILVDLDGTSGIGSSFIDEAFGGLVFACGMPAEDVRSRVRVKSDLDESYLIDFQDSLSQARPGRIRSSG